MRQVHPTTTHRGFFEKAPSERPAPARPEGVRWSVIAGLAAFAVLLTLAYALAGR